MHLRQAPSGRRGRRLIVLASLLLPAVLLLAACADDPLGPDTGAEPAAKAAARQAPGVAANGGRPTGGLRIDVTPDDTGATWILWGPGGRRHGQGDTLIADAGIGTYHIAWGDVEGWTTPDRSKGFLTRDGELVLTGSYGWISSLPFPASPEQLMANFRTVYETMDAAEFGQLLHPDFVCLLQPATQEEFPHVGPTLDRDEELVIATKMFSGEATTNSQGDLVPGVGGIDFALFQRVEPWQVTPPTDPIPGALAALFEVVVLWNRPGQSTLRAEGMLRFYVASRDSLHDGVVQPYHEMVGQQDLTGGFKASDGRIVWDKAVETTSWGTVKALWY
jgi:hypothetical protein